MAKYTDHVSLICAVPHKYLQYDAASALITALVADLRSGARTEKDWHVDLELANRSLDEAILQLIRPLRRLIRRSQSTWTTRLVTVVVVVAAPTVRRSATGPDRLKPTGRKGSPRAGERQACLFPSARAADTHVSTLPACSTLSAAGPTPAIAGIRSRRPSVAIENLPRYSVGQFQHLGLERSRRSSHELGLLWRQRQPTPPLHADLPRRADRRLSLLRGR